MTTLKKIVVMALMFSFLLSGIGLASSYDMQCLNHKGKFSGCQVTIENNRLKIDYKAKGEKDLNIDVPGKNIKSLSGGEYSRRRVAEGILLTPWLLFSKKKRDQIGIEYVDEKNNAKATMIESKKKYGLALKTELKALSGKEIQEEEKKK